MDISTIWKPEYSVGHQEIDLQHKYLFELWMMLDSIKDQPHNRRSLEQALISLLDYIDLHFSTEENYYREHPQFVEHQQIHRNFVARVQQFEQELQNGSPDIRELVAYLHDWLIDHIVNTDIRYFRDMEQKHSSGTT